MGRRSMAGVELDLNTCVFPLNSASSLPFSVHDRRSEISGPSRNYRMTVYVLRRYIVWHVLLRMFSNTTPAIGQ